MDTDIMVGDDGDADRPCLADASSCRLSHCTQFDDLPSELVHTVLSFVGAPERVVCLHVSRLWRATVLRLRDRRPPFHGEHGNSDRAFRKRQRQTFLYQATRAGYSSLVEWAHTQGCPWDALAPTAALKGGHACLFRRLIDLGSPWRHADCMRAAGMRGDTDVLKWIVARTDPLDSACDLMADIAGAGHLDALALVSDHCRRFCNPLCSWFNLDQIAAGAAAGLILPCPCTDQVMRQAADGGHVHILAWLYERGYRARFCAVVAAARAGHIQVLEWLSDRGIQFDKAIYCAAAADGGRLNVLVWLRAAGCPWDDRTCLYSAARGHMDLLEWAMLRGCPWHVEATATAAARGHLNVAKWCLARGCNVVNDIRPDWPDLYARGNDDNDDGDDDDGDRPDREALSVAARLGRIDVLEWLRDHGCICSDAWIFVEASQSPHMEETLDWVHANCIPWGAEASMCVAANGTLAGLKHMRARGCDWDGHVYTEAAAWGRIDVLDWAYANGCPWDNECAFRIVEYSSVVCDALVLRWTIEHGCPWSPRIAMRVAFSQDEPTFFAWIAERGLTWDPVACAAAAARHKHIQTVDWIVAHADIP